VVSDDPEQDRLARVALIRDRTDAEVRAGGLCGALFFSGLCSFIFGFTGCVVVVAVMGHYSHTVVEFRGGVLWLSWFGVFLGCGSLLLTLFRLWRARASALR
jgi:hypothetical protein